MEILILSHPSAKTKKTISCHIPSRSQTSKIIIIIFLIIVMIIKWQFSYYLTHLKSRGPTHFMSQTRRLSSCKLTSTTCSDLWSSLSQWLKMYIIIIIIIIMVIIIPMIIYVHHHYHHFHDLNSSQPPLPAVIVLVNISSMATNIIAFRFNTKITIRPDVENTTIVKL